ncbi:hypothetical protein K8R47_02570 [archaeon]|nr:hypothetical protein [archaeon]
MTNTQIDQNYLGLYRFLESQTYDLRDLSGKGSAIEILTAEDSEGMGIYTSEGNYFGKIFFKPKGDEPKWILRCSEDVPSETAIGLQDQICDTSRIRVDLEHKAVEA